MSSFCWARLDQNGPETVTTTIRVDRETKEEASRIFKELGLSLSGGIEVCLRAVVREQGLPFDMTLHKTGK